MTKINAITFKKCEREVLRDAIEAWIDTNQESAKDLFETEPEQAMECMARITHLRAVLDKLNRIES
jgi:hypothetical protein